MKVRRNQSSLVGLFLLAFLLFGIFPARSFAAFEERGNSAVALGLGCSLASDPTDPSGRAFNPAAAAWADRFGFRIGYARPYELKELDRLRADLVYPFGNRVAGLSLSSFGGELYSERQLALSLSQRFGKRLALGAAIGQQQLDIKNYGSDQVWFADAGLLVHLGYVQLGLGGTNLFTTTMERYGSNSVPREQGVASLRFQPDRRYAMLFEAQFEEFSAPAFHFGGEFELYPNLLMRMGYETASKRMHLGIGLSVEGLVVDGSYDKHPYLGWTQAFGFGWGVGSHAAD